MTCVGFIEAMAMQQKHLTNVVYSCHAFLSYLNKVISDLVLDFPYDKYRQGLSLEVEAVAMKKQKGQ